jgi:hypothetical protein
MVRKFRVDAACCHAGSLARKKFSMDVVKMQTKLIFDELHNPSSPTILPPLALLTPRSKLILEEISH